MHLIDFLEKHSTYFLERFYELNENQQEKIIERYWYKCRTYKKPEAIENLLEKIIHDIVYIEN